MLLPQRSEVIIQAPWCPRKLERALKIAIWHLSAAGWLGRGAQQRRIDMGIAHSAPIRRAAAGQLARPAVSRAPWLLVAAGPLRSQDILPRNT